MELEFERLEKEAERKHQEMWLNFLSIMFGQSPQSGESPKTKQARQQFIEMLRPQAKLKPKPYSWGEEVEQEMQPLLEHPEQGG